MTDETQPITNDADVIDSRDVIARIDHLTGLVTDAEYAADFDPITEEERAELATLEEVAKEGAGYAADWLHGEQLIRDSYFIESIKETVEDCYEMPEGFSSGEWPWRHMTMDWDAAAEEAKSDYTSIDFGDVTYWIR